MSGQARLREVGAGGAALELDEKRFSRLGWGLVLLGFVGFLLWAGLAPLDKGVGVSGTVMVAGSRKAVQHPTGGLVRHIRVHEGERVEAGQVLLEMDATQARAQADGLFAQYLAALASLARLSAERDEKARIEFPAELLALDDPRLPTLLEQQRQLHDSRRRALRLELDGLAETVAGSQAQLDGLQAALRSKEQQRAALEEQLRGLRQLASEGYVPRNRLLDSERLLAQVNGEIAGDLGSLGSTRRQILELRLRMAQRREKFQEEVRASLADAQVRAEELRNRLASARFDLANSEVRAPVAGLVVGRQRPQTASGITFITLEDEFGMLNVVVRHDLAERQRRPFLESRLLQVEGILESSGEVRHVIAGRLHDLTPLLTGLVVRSRDFH